MRTYETRRVSPAPERWPVAGELRLRLGEQTRTPGSGRVYPVRRSPRHAGFLHASSVSGPTGTQRERRRDPGRPPAVLEDPTFSGPAGPPGLRRGRHRDQALASWRRSEAVRLKAAGHTYEQVAQQLGDPRSVPASVGGCAAHPRRRRAAAQLRAGVAGTPWVSAQRAASGRRPHAVRRSMSRSRAVQIQVPGCLQPLFRELPVTGRGAWPRFLTTA